MIIINTSDAPRALRFLRFVRYSPLRSFLSFRRQGYAPSTHAIVRLLRTGWEDVRSDSALLHNVLCWYLVHGTELRNHQLLILRGERIKNGSATSKERRYRDGPTYHSI